MCFADTIMPLDRPTTYAATAVTLTEAITAYNASTCAVELWTGGARGLTSWPGNEKRRTLSWIITSNRQRRGDAHDRVWMAFVVTVLLRWLGKPKWRRELVEIPGSQYIGWPRLSDNAQGTGSQALV